MKINHNLTETDTNNIDVESQLEHQVQTHERKESDWLFDKINTMKIRFYETGEIKSSSYVNFSVRTNGSINIENDDK